MDDSKILKALHDHYKESIFITDGDGNIIFVNKVAAERINRSCEFLLGKNVRDLVKEGVYSRSTTLKAIATKKPVAGSINDANRRTFSNSVPVLDENGEVAMVVTNNMSLEHKEEWEKVMSDAMLTNEKLTRELESIRLKGHRTVVAESMVMKTLLSQIEAIAPTESNVVLLGESGTGKDVLASMIYEKSNRSKAAFISINCAAMPEALLESELFGYEGGAFTGASSKGKIGLFEAASGGTIFLDEIAEMPPALQAKLLRVIENREVRRVGGV